MILKVLMLANSNQIRLLVNILKNNYFDIIFNAKHASFLIWKLLIYLKRKITNRKHYDEYYDEDIFMNLKQNNYYKILHIRSLK